MCYWNCFLKAGYSLSLRQKGLEQNGLLMKVKGFAFEDIKEVKEEDFQFLGDFPFLDQSMPELIVKSYIIKSFRK